MQIIKHSANLTRTQSVRRLIVHEKNSHWTATLEREWFGIRPAQIRWRPYQQELQAEFHDHDLALLILEPDEPALELLAKLQAITSQTRIVCFIEEENKDWELIARELGVKAILPLTSPYPEMLKLVENLMEFDS